MLWAVGLLSMVLVAPAPAPHAPARQSSGKGLAIAAGVVGGVGLALNVMRAAFFASGCKSAGYHYEDGCFGSIGPAGATLAFGLPATVANITAMGLAFGAGRKWGRTGASGRIGRRRAILAGSILLGVGIAGQIVGGGLALHPTLADSTDIYSDGTGDRMLGFYVGGIAASQAGAMIGGAGAGLLGVGLSRPADDGVRVGIAPGGVVVRF